MLFSAHHGFVKGKSTCTNLLECVNDCTLIVHNKTSVTVTYMDFSKTFDTVSHEKRFLFVYIRMVYVDPYMYI